MNKSKILDEFYQGRYCGWCKAVTEHLVSKVDEEGNGELIGYYAECMNCSSIEDIDYNVIYAK